MLAMPHHHPADVRPQKIHQRRMRVVLVIGMLMMQPVHGHPAGRRVLQRANAENGKDVLQPLGNRQSPMREDAVIAEGYAKQPIQRKTKNSHHHARPTEIPRNEH